MNKTPLFAHLRNDIPAALVVFLVALPLCLGIALASGAPPLAGVVAGIVGGIVVGAFSGSRVGVSGPAAGLTVIVLLAIQDLGSFNLFLCAVILAGAMQVVMGIMRLGVIAYYFPSSVIKGMLAGIGLIIIQKEIPYALGLPEGFGFTRIFTSPGEYFGSVHWGAVLITATALAFLIAWDMPKIKESALGKVPGPLLAVLAGIGLGFFFSTSATLKMAPALFIDLPNITFSNIGEVLHAPDLGGFTLPAVWKSAAVIAIVASLETLLCVEATDKMDPHRNITPTNRELVAQGIGNSVSGFVGGLPVTQVIVRSSANIMTGGRTKLSMILHGVFLLLALVFGAAIMRTIPMAALAAVLFVVGYKLAKPALFKEMWVKGRSQFIPFIATVVGVVLTDLLTGVMIGMSLGIFTILYNNYVIPFHFDPRKYVDGQTVRMELSEDVSFLNKASIQRTLHQLPRGAHVIVDASRCIGLDPDVEEIIRDAARRGPRRGVNIELVGLGESRTGHSIRSPENNLQDYLSEALGERGKEGEQSNEGEQSDEPRRESASAS